MLSLTIATIPLQFGVFFVRGVSGTGEAAVIGLAQQVTAVFTMLVGLCGRILEPHIAGPYGRRRTFILKLVAFTSAVWALLFACAIIGVGLATNYLLKADFTGAFWPVVYLL